MRPVSPGSATYSGSVALNSADDPRKRVIDKVSKRLLWFLFLLFVFSFLDRINIGFAGLTLVKDLGLTSRQFGLAASLFYIAYIACGVPSNMILARIGARRWIATIMIVWGLASSATMFASNANTLCILRIFVGIAEAGFLPGMLLYMTLWFPADYRARANSLFMTAMPVTAAIGSALSGYILALDGVWGLKGWQWLFALEGLPASILGLVVLCYLDDKPQTAQWLSKGEKTILEHCLQADRVPVSVKAGEFLPEQRVFTELLSPTVIKFICSYFCLVNTFAMLAIWTPLIVKSFSVGASNRTIGLLASVPQVVTIVVMVWWSRRSDIRQERRWHVLLPMLVAAAGWMFTVMSGQPLVQLLGLCMASSGVYAALPVFWASPDQVLSFKFQAIGIAVINAAGNVSSVLNPIIVGWLNDVTHSFAASIYYAASLLVVGAIVVSTLPIIGGKREQQ